MRYERVSMPGTEFEPIFWGPAAGPFQRELALVCPKAAVLKDWAVHSLVMLSSEL